MPSHGSVWKKSDHSESPKSAELDPADPPADASPADPPGAYARPPPADPPASEVSIPSKKPSPKSQTLVADDSDQPT
jgi:hypothetical protein